jgi:5-methylcytosine-specific restriction endonuclease McrA
MEMKMARLSDLNLFDVGNALQMAGAVYTGKGKVYLALFPDEAGDISRGTTFQSQAHGQDLEVETLSMTQDDWATFIRQTDLLETEVIARSTDGTLAKVVVRKSQRQIEQGVSWKVFKRDGYECRYCGNDDTPLTVDHLVCWEAGGPSIIENLVAACRKCNKIRGDLPYEQWLQHPHYTRVSKNLDEATREANRKLIETLSSIPLQTSKRSR